MKGLLLFVGGFLVGALTLQTGIAQNRNQRVLNHIGIRTLHYEQELDFYKRVLGAKEAFTLHDDSGGVRLTYLQLSRDTFVELLPVKDGPTAGAVHFGIETSDAAASVAQFRAQGVTAEDARVGYTKSLIARIKDPDGVEIEVMQMGPDSLQRKAIDTWK